MRVAFGRRRGLSVATSARARVTAVATAVALMLGAQLALVVVGGAIANGDARATLDDSMTFLGDVSEERVLEYVRAGEETATDAAHLIERQAVDTDDLVGLLHAVASTREQVASTRVTYANGGSVDLSRAPQDKAGFESRITEVSEDGVRTERLTLFDERMGVIAESSSPVLATPTPVACFDEAASSQAVVWSEPSIDPKTGRVVIWACHAAWDRDGRLLAVASASLRLNDLGQVLNDLPVQVEGEVFVLTSKGAIVAGPTGFGASLQRLAISKSRLPMAYELGVKSDAVVVSRSGADRRVDEGDVAIIERAVDAGGVDWVIHLRAVEDTVAPGYARLSLTLNLLTVSLLLLTFGLAYLLWRLRDPWKAVLAGAERDPLTGLFNRRELDDRAANVARLAQRSGRTVAAIVLDLDNFKGVNDALGHGAGDKALREIGSALLANLRAGDVAVRMGGDEFLVLAVVADSDDGARAAERVRAAVADVLARAFDGELALGVTAGFAIGGEEDPQLAHAVAAADVALIRGKRKAKGVTYAAKGARRTAKTSHDG